MIDVVIPVAFGMILLALLLNFWRLLRGPTSVDRVVALDTMYVNSLALLVLLGVQRDDTLYFEVGLIIAMLGFAGTIALAKFLFRGRVVE
jgi:multicomponent K+:H+ antiporter subunit F